MTLVRLNGGPDSLLPVTSGGCGAGVCVWEKGVQHFPPSFVYTCGSLWGFHSIPGRRECNLPGCRGSLWEGADGFSGGRHSISFWPSPWIPANLWSEGPRMLELYLHEDWGHLAQASDKVTRRQETVIPTTSEWDFAI